MWLMQQTPTAVITIYSDKAECTFQKLKPPPWSKSSVGFFCLKPSEKVVERSGGRLPASEITDWIAEQWVEDYPCDRNMWDVKPICRLLTM